MLRPLLERNPDLTFHGRSIVLLPVRHIWREVLIDRTGVKDFRRIVSNLQLLVQHDGRFSLTHCKPIYSPAHWWKLSDPDFASRLIDKIEPGVLDELRAIRTLDDYVQYVPSGGIPSPAFGRPDLERLLVEIARGNLDAATIICEALRSGRTRYGGPYLAELYEPIIDRLSPLIQACDRAGLARVLREYEELTVKTNKLEDLWEPTPFPLELQGDVA